MMVSIGIMQGRVVPEDPTRLQIFPTSHWEEEFRRIPQLGFGYVEILVDKAGACENLLAEPAFRSWLQRDRDVTQVGVKSACLDALCEISATQNPDVFMTALKGLVNLFSHTSVETLIVPFFDQNQVSGKDELVEVLHLLDDSGLDHLAGQAGLRLALEVCLPATELLAAIQAKPLATSGFCYDLGNAGGCGFDTASEILQLHPYIRHIHIKDKPFNGPNVMLGSGVVDFKASFRALKQIGYSGLMILETMYSHSPEAEAVQNLNFVLHTLNTLDAA